VVVAVHRQHPLPQSFVPVTRVRYCGKSPGTDVTVFKIFSPKIDAF
jgi:hypothetical protein